MTGGCKPCQDSDRWRISREHNHGGLIGTRLGCGFRTRAVLGTGPAAACLGGGDPISRLRDLLGDLVDFFTLLCDYMLLNLTDVRVDLR
jgi:hypothetical protein